MIWAHELFVTLEVTGKCLLLLGFMDNGSTFTGRTLGSSDESCAAVVRTSPLGAQVSTLALSERLLGREHGVTTCSCHSLHPEGDQFQAGCYSPAVCLSDDLPSYNRSTVNGRTLGSSESHAIIVGTSPRIARVSSTSNPNNLTPLDHCPQSTSSSEPEWASQDRCLCFFRVQLPPNSALAFASIVTSYLFRGIHQHETIFFILDIKDLGQLSQT
jgi:hypothetical protein